MCPTKLDKKSTFEMMKNVNFFNVLQHKLGHIVLCFSLGIDFTPQIPAVYV